MYAVLLTGGKQYRVQEGDVIYVEKLNAEVDSTIELTEVLAVSNGETLTVGAPVVEGAKVVAKVAAQGKAKKVTVFKYKPKKDYRKKTGHRQPYTKLVITSYSGAQTRKNWLSAQYFLYTCPHTLW